MSESLELLACASLHVSTGAITLYDFENPHAALKFLSLKEQQMAERTLERCRSLNAAILYPGHPRYPDCFLTLELPPLFLSVLGSVECLASDQRLAVVGSRELSARANEWMAAELPLVLQKCPQAVLISGGARGADQAAHLASIRSGRATVCFLPSGLGEIYPPSLNSWVKPLIETGGCFVSQFPPDETAKRHHFERRNELIVSLSHVVFVTEASRRSGSLMTARFATEQGRELAALPSFPGDAVGAGTLDLLKSHAQMICDSEDLAIYLGRVRPLRSVPRATESDTGCDGIQTVRKPHGDRGRQLALTCSSLGSDVENVVNDDHSDYDDHAARFDISPIGNSAETNAYKCEQDTRSTERQAFVKLRFER